MKFLILLFLLAFSACGFGIELREDDGGIEVWASDERMILRYHKEESEVPEGMSGEYRRSGYIHPVMTPDGREVTGDYEPDHAHQHGVFLAWTSGRYAGRKVDFWNQQKVEGRVAHRRVVEVVRGDDEVSFSVELSHFDQREGGVEILREVWKVTVRDGGDFYGFDIESRQRLVAPKPLVVGKYHYGGMAWRGRSAWLGEDGCEFLTSEGKARVGGNHSRPDWVRVSGEVDGKAASVVVMGDRRNFRAPQPVRIHPDKPYFCFAPMVLDEFSIGAGDEFVSRYRFLVSGEKVEPEWVAERWDEYAGEKEGERPHIVLVMTDDQGWGQTGYYGHPVLKTPNLDAMAENGLRLDRFYAGAPVCSPTRASVLTGRSNDRTGVERHGFALRLREKVLPRALRKVGYATGHFGKWHLNGLRGPGVPVLKNDAYGPGRFGFDRWLSVTNFFDVDPVMSRGGEFEEFRGDSSEIIVAEALKFIGEKVAEGKPTFSVIWYGTPHSPFRCSEEDREAFGHLNETSAQHYGELVAMDRSVGTLRAGLRKLGIAEDTLIWFNSDNGGLPKIKPGTVGGLRGFKGGLYEGGLRVPALVEWPAKIKPRVTKFPSCTMDIFPTIAEIVGLPEESMMQPQDGMSLRALFDGEVGKRSKAIPFRSEGRAALIDNDRKLIRLGDGKKRRYELYDLGDDPGEAEDLSGSSVEVFREMRERLEAWSASVDVSVGGKDYPEGDVEAGYPERREWRKVDAYRGYFEGWRGRPEYRRWLGR